MSKQQHHFTLKVRNLKDLAIPPEQDPFSDDELVRSGESALMRAIRRWESTGEWDFSTVMIHLPSKIHQETDTNQASQKLIHYLQGQFEENSEKMYLFKKNLIRTFRNAFMFLTLCMVLVSLVSHPAFLPNMPPVIRKVLTEGFTVIGWVVLWRPVELMINVLGQLRKENKIYQKLINAPIQFISDDGF